MPLSSESLLAERKSRIRRFQAIVQDSEGESKTTLLAKARLMMGIKRSTAYDYFETMQGAGVIIEEGGQVWTAQGYERLRQEKLQDEARREELMVKVTTMDAFNTSDS